SLSLQLANDLLRYYTGDPRESVTTVLSVDVMQPLLRGFGKNSDAVEALTQAERNLIYAIRDFDQFQKQFAVDIISSYFSLLSQKDIVRNNYTNYLRRVETTRYLEARSVDRARRSEVDDARAAELGARISYINSVASYLSQLDAFKIQLGLPVNTRLYLEDGDLQELTQRGLVPVEVDRDVAFRLAVERHADVLNAIDRFEDRRRKVRLAADKLKPGLNFIGSADYRATESIDYTHFDPDKFSYSVGLQLDLPLDRLDERNAFRTTLIQFEQQLRSLSLTLDQFRDRIDRGLRTLEQTRLNYLDRLAELEVNRRRVDQSQILLQAGRAQIRDLREAQDLLIAAQNAVTRTRVDYLRARLQLLLDMGVLPTEGDRFWLHDPLPDLIREDQRGTNPLQMPKDQVLPPNYFLEARHETP
ncbi:MAG: TolC family protein, partial [Verrucomicrobia bacterium]